LIVPVHTLHRREAALAAVAIQQPRKPMLPLALALAKTATKKIRKGVS
jgi:hypothetical protein